MRKEHHGESSHYKVRCYDSHDHGKTRSLLRDEDFLGVHSCDLVSGVEDGKPVVVQYLVFYV